MSLARSQRIRVHGIVDGNRLAVAQLVVAVADDLGALVEAAENFDAAVADLAGLDLRQRNGPVAVGFVDDEDRFAVSTSANMPGRSCPSGFCMSARMRTLRDAVWMLGLMA